MGWARITGFVLGVLALAGASKASVLALDQPWILQQIFRSIGLGLIAAATLGPFIDKLSSQCVQILDKSILRDDARNMVALIILVLSYTIFWSAVTFQPTLLFSFRYGPG
jgi:hypothetical protein